MKIIILGAGQVGSSVAQALANEANDITIIDRDAAVLRNLQERMDVRIVAGHASHPDVLMRAGIEDAELILAVTNSDETNMVACQIAHSMFHIPTRLARVRSGSYLAHPRLFDAAAIAIDHIISPEQLVTTYIRHLIRQPGVLQILEFGAGRVQMVAIEAHTDGGMTGRPLRDLAAMLPRKPMRVVAIYRGDQSMPTDGDALIEADDEVFFLAAREDTASVTRVFRPPDRAGRRIMIAGGGNIGYQLAAATEDSYRVKIIEQ
ncbi:MAG: Trk system potassium transporter TrkA, partial [Burkholderiaceae bacterium]